MFGMFHKQEDRVEDVNLLTLSRFLPLHQSEASILYGENNIPSPTLNIIR